MPNPYFRFKQFTVYHDRCAMKVTTDGCLFGAWCAALLENKEGKALDIGTGTGLLSLMVAQKTSLEVDAVELDAEAAAQAAQNIAQSPWNNRIRVHHSDIQHFQPAAPYPFIFSNPPFYEKEWQSDAAGRNVAHHGLGLRLGSLVSEMARLLAPEGTALLLLPFKREKEIQKVFSAGGLHAHQTITVHPSAAHPPFRLLMAVSHKPADAPLNKTLFIREKEGVYSTAFTALLKDYYLYL